MREAVFSSPFFGITLSLAAYCIGVMICRRTSLAICNPLLISYLIIIPTLLLDQLPDHHPDSASGRHSAGMV